MRLKSVSPVSKVPFSHVAINRPTQALPAQIKRRKALEPQGQSYQGDAPPLPDVKGIKASRRAAVYVGDLYLQYPNCGLAIAVEILSRIASDNIQDHAILKRMATSRHNKLQQAGTEHQLDGIKGERKSAIFSLMSCLASQAPSLLPLLGNAGTKPMLESVQAAITPFMQPALNALEKNGFMGGQFEADEARIKKSLTDQQATIAKQSEEAFASAYEESRKALEKVWDLMRAVNRNETQPH